MTPTVFSLVCHRGSGIPEPLSAEVAVTGVHPHFAVASSDSSAMAYATAPNPAAAATAIASASADADVATAALSSSASSSIADLSPSKAATAATSYRPLAPSSPLRAAPSLAAASAPPAAAPPAAVAASAAGPPSFSVAASSPINAAGTAYRPPAPTSPSTAADAFSSSSSLVGTSSPLLRSDAAIAPSFSDDIVPIGATTTTSTASGPTTSHILAALSTSLPTSAAAMPSSSVAVSSDSSTSPDALLSCSASVAMCRANAGAASVSPGASKTVAGFFSSPKFLRSNVIRAAASSPPPPPHMDTVGHTTDPSPPTIVLAPLPATTTTAAAAAVATPTAAAVATPTAAAVARTTAGAVATTTAAATPIIVTATPTIGATTPTTPQSSCAASTVSSSSSAAHTTPPSSAGSTASSSPAALTAARTAAACDPAPSSAATVVPPSSSSRLIAAAPLSSATIAAPSSLLSPNAASLSSGAIAAPCSSAPPIAASSSSVAYRAPPPHTTFAGITASSPSSSTIIATPQLSSAAAAAPVAASSSSAPCRPSSPSCTTSISNREAPPTSPAACFTAARSCAVYTTSPSSAAIKATPSSCAPPTITRGTRTSSSNSNSRLPPAPSSCAPTITTEDPSTCSTNSRLPPVPSSSAAMKAAPSFSSAATTAGAPSFTTAQPPAASAASRTTYTGSREATPTPSAACRAPLTSAAIKATPSSSSAAVRAPSPVFSGGSTTKTSLSSVATTASPSCTNSREPPRTPPAACRPAQASAAAASAAAAPAASSPSSCTDSREAPSLQSGAYRAPQASVAPGPSFAAGTPDGVNNATTTKTSSSSQHNYCGPNGEIYRHRKTADYVRRAKKHHRKDIHPKDWGKYGYYCNPICEVSFSIPQNVPRIHRSNTQLRDFLAGYEIPCVPVLLHGWIDDWPAMQKWDLKTLEKNYRNARFKVGEKDDGEKIRMKMKYFIDYLENQRDDTPLYLFESSLEDKADTCGLLKDWTIPEIFPVDLHCIVGEEKRPPHRWFCIGPKRSGTTVHIDPLGTAAWNAVTHGYKRWALFPPSVPKHVVKARHLMLPGEDDEAIMWFDNLLPRIRQHHPEVPVFECIQGPGEVIYVPGGWWHAVLNLTDCVACTQNFVSFSFLPSAWRCTRRSRRKFAVFWKERFEKFLPEPVGLGVINACNAADAWEIRDGRYCRIRRVLGQASGVYGTDTSSSSGSSSSSSSSSDSESSDDEDELEQIRQKIEEMKRKVDDTCWNLYMSTNAVRELQRFHSSGAQLLQLSSTPAHTVRNNNCARNNAAHSRSRLTTSLTCAKTMAGQCIMASANAAAQQRTTVPVTAETMAQRQAVAASPAVTGLLCDHSSLEASEISVTTDSSRAVGFVRNDPVAGPGTLRPAQAAIGGVPSASRHMEECTSVAISGPRSRTTPEISGLAPLASACRGSKAAEEPHKNGAERPLQDCLASLARREERSFSEPERVAEVNFTVQKMHSFTSGERTYPCETPTTVSAPTVLSAETQRKATAPPGRLRSADAHSQVSDSGVTKKAEQVHGEEKTCGISGRQSQTTAICNGSGLPTNTTVQSVPWTSFSASTSSCGQDHGVKRLQRTSRRCRETNAAPEATSVEKVVAQYSSENVQARPLTDQPVISAEQSAEIAGTAPAQGATGAWAENALAATSTHMGNLPAHLEARPKSRVQGGSTTPQDALGSLSCLNTSTDEASTAAASAVAPEFSVEIEDGVAATVATSHSVIPLQAEYTTCVAAGTTQPAGRSGKPVAGLDSENGENVAREELLLCHGDCVSSNPNSPPSASMGNSNMKRRSDSYILEGDTVDVQLSPQRVDVFHSDSAESRVVLTEVNSNAPGVADMETGSGIDNREPVHSFTKRTRVEGKQSYCAV